MVDIDVPIWEKHLVLIAGNTLTIEANKENVYVYRRADGSGQYEYRIMPEGTLLREEEKEEALDMMFTKKHYMSIGESIGKAVKNMSKAVPPERLDDVLNGMSVLISQLAADFEKDNPRFQREAFLESLKPKAESPK